jgi:aspartate racemase
MKTAGIVGGIGPESTIDYYRSIVALYRERRPDGSYPPLIINSVDLQTVLAHVSAGRLDALADYMLEAIGKLASAGAAFGAMASNTPHIAYGLIAQRSPIPLVSIVDAAAEAAIKRKLKRAGIVGTRFTMQASFYPDAFRRAGIEMVAPSQEEQAVVHDIYMNELVNGVFRDESRARLLQVAAQMQKRDRIDGLALAGTELPLILRRHELPGLPFLDTAQIHVERIVERMIS